MVHFVKKNVAPTPPKKNETQCPNNLWRAAFFRAFDLAGNVLFDSYNSTRPNDVPRKLLDVFNRLIFCGMHFCKLPIIIRFISNRGTESHVRTYSRAQLQCGRLQTNLTITSRNRYGELSDICLAYHTIFSVPT